MGQKGKFFLRLYTFSWIKFSLFVQILKRFQNAAFSFIDTYQKLICTIQIQIRFHSEVIFFQPQVWHTNPFKCVFAKFKGFVSFGVSTIMVRGFWIGLQSLLLQPRISHCSAFLVFFFLQSDIVSLILKKTQEKNRKVHTCTTKTPEKSRLRLTQFLETNKAIILLL